MQLRSMDKERFSMELICTDWYFESFNFWKKESWVKTGKEYTGIGRNDVGKGKKQRKSTECTTKCNTFDTTEYLELPLILF